MPGYPVPFIKFREDDNNGFPLAGGKLFSYAAGTSTPLATYFDPDLAVGHENTNPVILDASGRANVWIPAGTGYKFILADRLDNIIWTQDSVQIPAGGGATTAPGPGPSPSAQQVPTGSIFPYAGSSAPTDFLLCDGAALSRTTYAALFAVVGETFGNGNGSTTFNVPNLQQRFPLGKALGGTGATLGSSGGQIDHVHTGPSHTHTIGAHTHTVAAHAHTLDQGAWGPPIAGITGSHPNDVMLGGGGGGQGYFAGTNPASTSAQALQTTSPTSLTTDAAGTNNTGIANPPFLTVNFIIKT